MPPVDRFVGDVAGRLIEVGSLGLRHRAFALGEALFLELLDRLLHLAELPRRQIDLAILALRSRLRDALHQVAASGNDRGRHGGVVARATSLPAASVTKTSARAKSGPTPDQAEVDGDSVRSD